MHDPTDLTGHNDNDLRPEVDLQQVISNKKEVYVALPADVRYELHALKRCMASQVSLSDQIDAANPGNPWASLMVREDVGKLENLIARIKKIYREHKP